MSSENTSSSELETRNLCIDTSEYVAIRFVFTEGQIRRLTELAKAGKVNAKSSPILAKPRKT
jgi:hypothetical protein